MFEQLYGHEAVIDQLQKDIERRRMPSAVLLYGDQYSGRMTTSLEIARALSCERMGTGACTCARCKQQRILHDPYCMILARRDHNPEIEAALDTLRRVRTHASRILFIRTVRLLIRQYHSAFYDVCPSNKRQNFELAADIDDDLHQMLEMSFHDEDVEQIIALADKIVKTSRKLEHGITKVIPVRYIRNIATWLHATPEDTKRIVIIEGIDEFNDSAVNSMLKILEEPPANTYFILIAKNKNTIIPTILSRVRPYYLGDRSREEEKVIEQVYHDASDEYDSLRTFFATKHGIDCRSLREQAENFLFTALKRRVVSHVGIEEIITAVSRAKQMKMFFTEIALILEEEVTDGFVTDLQAMRMMRDMAELLQKSDIYNQGDALMMETLFYRISGTV